MVAPRVEFPVDQLTQAAAAVEQGLQQFRHNLLEKVGTQILSFVKLDYVTKSRGGTGTDGIHWAPIKVSTILARLQHTAKHIKAKPVRAPKGKAAKTRFGKPVTVRTVTAAGARTRKGESHKANQALFLQLAKAGVQFRDSNGRLIKGRGDRAKAGVTIHLSKEVANKRVNLSPGSYQIGVDTGLQLNSASPGYSGPDGKGGNVMTYTEDSVTVGFGRSYSGYFDKHRKLMPEVLPEPWRKELEDMVATVGGRIVEEKLRDEGVT